MGSVDMKWKQKKHVKCFKQWTTKNKLPALKPHNACTNVKKRKKKNKRNLNMCNVANKDSKLPTLNPHYSEH